MVVGGLQSRSGQTQHGPAGLTRVLAR
jgi:hypothetical protein